MGTNLIRFAKGFYTLVRGQRDALEYLTRHNGEYVGSFSSFGRLIDDEATNIRKELIALDEKGLISIDIRYVDGKKQMAFRLADGWIDKVVQDYTDEFVPSKKSRKRKKKD